MRVNLFSAADSGPSSQIRFRQHDIMLLRANWSYFRFCLEA